MLDDNEKLKHRDAVKSQDWIKPQGDIRTERTLHRADSRRQSILRKRIKNASEEQVQALVEEPINVTAFHECITGLQAHSASKKLASLVSLRTFLSRANAPFEATIQRGAVVTLCEFLAHPDDDIKLEASWCLINLAAAAEEYSRHVLKAVPLLITFLEAENIHLNEHACWCIGNLAGEMNAEFGAVLISNGVALPLIHLLQRLSQRSQRSSSCYAVGWWCMSNLSRHLRFSEWASQYQVQDFLLQTAASVDDSIRPDVWWTMVHCICENNQDAVLLIQSGLLAVMQQYIMNDNISLENDASLLPIIRTMGHLSSYSPSLLQESADVADMLSSWLNILMRVDESAVLKEGAWMVNNVIALFSALRMPLATQLLELAHKLLFCTHLEIQREGMIVLGNLSDLPELAAWIAQHVPVLDRVIDMTIINDPQVQMAGLLTLRNCVQNPLRANIQSISRRSEQIAALLHAGTHNHIHELVSNTLAAVVDIQT